MNCAHRQPHPIARLSGRLPQLIIAGFSLSLATGLTGCQYRHPPIEPALLMASLPIPFTKPVSSTLPYGSAIRFAVDSLPAGVTLEYSADDGQHWQTGDSLLLQTATNLKLRSRRGPYVSAISTTPFVVSFKRVLIVGNSITRHAPEPETGWLGDWGMAASAPANDYVHQLTERFRKLDSQVVINVYNGVPFEQQFWTFKYSEARSLAAFKPDLVIMRIGENVPAGSITSRNFKQYYQQLIDSVTVNYAPVKIICTTSFFDQPTTSDAIRQVAASRKFYLVDFYGLVNNRQFQAYDRFKNASVAAHPGDKGMQAITELIWDKVH